MLGLFVEWLDVFDLRWHLARWLAKQYAWSYHRVIERQGLTWTMELIDEDEQLLGYTYNHTLVRAGCVAYAEDRGLVARPYDVTKASTN